MEYAISDFWHAAHVKHTINLIWHFSHSFLFHYWLEIDFPSTRRAHVRVNNLFNWFFIINKCGGGWIGYQTTKISFYCFPLAHLSFSRSLFPCASSASARRNFNLSRLGASSSSLNIFHWIVLKEFSSFHVRCCIRYPSMRLRA